MEPGAGSPPQQALSVRTRTPSRRRAGAPARSARHSKPSRNTTSPTGRANASSTCAVYANGSTVSPHDSLNRAATSNGPDTVLVPRSGCQSSRAAKPPVVTDEVEVELQSALVLVRKLRSHDGSAALIRTETPKS